MEALQSLGDALTCAAAPQPWHPNLSSLAPQPTKKQSSDHRRHHHHHPLPFWLKPQSLSTVPGLLLGLTTQVHQRYQTDSCIEVAPYKHGKLFSMDNRRLYCLKESFSANRIIWVKLSMMLTILSRRPGEPSSPL